MEEGDDEDIGTEKRREESRGRGRVCSSGLAAPLLLLSHLISLPLLSSLGVRTIVSRQLFPLLLAPLKAIVYSILHVL
jgi:hypothetical protein